MIERLARWIDERVGGSSFVREKADKVFPESWTFLFGELALYCFVVLLVTGTFLALFFDASMAETTYHGSYEPLVGERMSAAYESVLNLSFDVRAGLLIRQMHHWAANLMVASIVVHLLRVFFTGAFRKPRDVNWMIGVTLFALAIAEGFAGYSMLDDVLSGIGLRISYGIVESVPLVGSWAASALFGGMFPGDEIVGRLFAVHVWVLPAVIGGLLALHLALVFRQVHTQFPGGGRREDNVVGIRLWPSYTARSVGLFLLTVAVVAALGGLFQINPVWFWGPYDPFVVSVAAQPDWYMGWLEGALRLFPPWETTIGGRMIANPFYPAVLFPTVFFGALYAYPWIERRLTGDHAVHHLLDRPRDRPVRTAFGMAVIAFLVVIFTAGSQDIIAHQLQVPLQGLVWTLRVLVLVAPVLAFAFTYRLMRDLQGAGRPEGEHRYAELETEAGDGGEREEGWRRGELVLVALARRLLGR